MGEIERLRARVDELEAELGYPTERRQAILQEKLKLSPSCAQLTLILFAANGGYRDRFYLSDRLDIEAVGNSVSMRVHYANRCAEIKLIENLFGHGYRITDSGKSAVRKALAETNHG